MLGGYMVHLCVPHHTWLRQAHSQNLRRHVSSHRCANGPTVSPMRTAIPAAIAALALAGCGGSADPEEVNEISAVLQSETSPLGIPVDKDQAQCLARAYLESGLSDEAIERLKDGEPLAPATDGDVKAIGKVFKKVADCI